MLQIIQPETIYENQIEAAKKIMKVLDSKRMCLFIAQPQEGKTGVHAAVHQMMAEKNKSIINHYEFLGIGDCTWKDQTQARMPYINVYGQVVSVVKVLHNPDIKKIEASKLINSFFTWDETHLADGLNNVIGDLLSKLGIKKDISSEDLEKILVERNIFILITSATAFNKHIQRTLNRAAGIPSIYDQVGLDTVPSYYGIEKAFELNRINDSLKSIFFHSKLHPTFNSLLIQFISTEKYLIIRLSQKDREKFKIYLNTYFGGIFNIKFHDDETKSSNSFINIEDLKNKPKKPTIIFIKNAMRQAVSLNTENIFAVWEQKNEQQTLATVTQALLGRMFGHNKEKDNVKIFTNIVAAKAYLNFIKNDVVNYPNPCKNVSCKAGIEAEEAVTINVTDIIDPNVVITKRGLSLSVKEKLLSHPEVQKYVEKYKDKQIQKNPTFRNAAHESNRDFFANLNTGARTIHGLNKNEWWGIVYKQKPEENKTELYIIQRSLSNPGLNTILKDSTFSTTSDVKKSTIG